MTDLPEPPPWVPQPGIGGLMLSFGILVALIARRVLTAAEAHEILDGQMILLEGLEADKGTGAGARAQMSAGLQDLAFLKRELQKFAPTRLPR
jgi:hypothetical protein